MTGASGYCWAGQPIADIRAWCRDRGECMVRYHAHREVVSPVTRRLEREDEDGEMPESFFDNLLMRDGWVYTETGRYRP